MQIQINIDSTSDYPQDYMSSFCGVSILDDIIYVNIRNLSDIYPKYSKKFKQKIEVQRLFDDHYKSVEYQTKTKSIFHHLHDIIKQQIENGTCYFNIVSDNQYSLINIDKACTNGCIIDFSNLTSTEIIELLKNYNFKDNVKFKDLYNPYSLLTQQQLLKTYQYVKEITDKIKKYNFTPMESLIFLYDMARRKPYRVFESNQSVSRDLSQITNSPYIVCEGYANYINAVCHALNIPCEKVYWYPKNGTKGHASNLVYINDDYYNIHQFVEIDAVYGVRKNEQDTDYINHYNYLFDPLHIADLRKKKYEYQNNLTACQPTIQYDRIKKLESFLPSTIIQLEFYNSLINKILNVSNMIGLEPLSSICKKEIEKIKQGQLNIEKIESIYQKYMQLMTKKIEEEYMMEAIYKVRRIEHLIDPKNYPLSPYIFDTIIKNSFPSSKQERLLNLIFEQTPIDKISNLPLLDNILVENSNDKMDFDIKRIELLDILKKELKNKKIKQKTKKNNT